VAKDQSTTKTPFRSFASREIQRKEVQTRDMRDHEKILTVRSPRILDRRSELHLGASPIATWSDENLHHRNHEMRTHDKIWTVRSPRILDRRSELHLGASPIATWSDENLHLRISEMRDHEKIRTVRSPRTRTVDLSSISESRLSRLGVTRISI
jgi:hypothetical protein